MIGLNDFFFDLLPGAKDSVAMRFRNFALILSPPVLCVKYGSPDIFIQALNYGGKYGISFLFGILPAVMTYRLKRIYQERKNSDDCSSNLLSTDNCINERGRETKISLKKIEEKTDFLTNDSILMTQAVLGFIIFAYL